MEVVTASQVLTSDPASHMYITNLVSLLFVPPLYLKIATHQQFWYSLTTPGCNYNRVVLTLICNNNNGNATRTFGFLTRVLYIWMLWSQIKLPWYAFNDPQNTSKLKKLHGHQSIIIFIFVCGQTSFGRRRPSEWKRPSMPNWVPVFRNRTVAYLCPDDISRITQSSMCKITCRLVPFIIMTHHNYWKKVFAVRLTVVLSRSQ